MVKNNWDRNLRYGNVLQLKTFFEWLIFNQIELPKGELLCYV